MDTRKAGFEVEKWEERDRLHISLLYRFADGEEHGIADWWDDDAREMFEDGFFTVRHPDLETSVIDYAVQNGLARHYIYGSGEYGCLYDNGPFLTFDLDSAVESLAGTFDLGRTRKARLKRDMSLELNPAKDGADYCEIQECSCARPEEHDGF